MDCCLGGDERGVSPVIGTVLMVAISVLLMTTVGVVVTQLGFYDDTSQMEVVYEESHEGGETTIRVGVASGEGDLDLLVDGEHPCDWDGPTHVEKGDVVTVTCSGSDVPSGESISVVHSGGRSTVVDRLDVEGAVPDFAVDITGDTAVEGDSIVIDGTVENEGGVAGTQDVTISVGGESETTSVTLEDGETESIELTWETDDGDAGEYAAQIRSDNDSAQAPVTVENEDGDDDESEHNFEIDSVAYDDEVTEGERVIFEVTVENTGSRSATEDVELEIINEESNTETVDVYEDLELGAGRSRTVTLEWNTNGREDERSYAATVRTAGDHDPTPTVHVTGDSSVAFETVTATVTAEGGNKGQGYGPSDVRFDYELSGATGDETVTFTVEVDGTEWSETTTGTAGTVTVSVGKKHPSYPAAITATVGGESCTATVYDDDEPVDVC